MSKKVALQILISEEMRRTIKVNSAMQQVNMATYVERIIEKELQECENKKNK